MLKALGIGDNVCDIYLHTRTMYPGGQALNFSANAKLMGADSAFIGVFGNDKVAKHVQDVIDEMMISRERCRYSEGENGFAKVIVENGDRIFKGSNKGGVIQQNPIVLDTQDLQYIDSFDIVHTTNNGFLDAQLPKLAPLHPLVSYDFSVSWKEEGKVNNVCPHIDVAFISCSGLEIKEAKEICQLIQEAGVDVVVATRGGDGALAFDGTAFYTQAADPAMPVDTMGAGDSFATAVMVCFGTFIMQNSFEKWRSQDCLRQLIPEALESASKQAAVSCGVHGAFGHGVSVPTELYDRIMLSI